MKTLTLLFLFLCLCSISYSQDESICGNTDFSMLDETTPYYLRDGFGQQVNMELAVVFIDFPDGRLNGTDQVFTQTQLGQFTGELDAIAELGCENIGGTLQQVAAKYTYFDRWNMIFSTGTFLGTAHPDNTTFLKVGYGSMKDYYNEVSNSKLTIVPAVTHNIQNPSDPRLNTGIINRVQDVNGRLIVKSLMLGKNKYGTLSNSYFGSKNAADLEFHNELYEDVRQKLIDSYPSEIDFDVTNYTGQILIVFAGGSQYVGGQAFIDEKYFTARATEHLFYDTTKYNWMDGIAVPVHELGHNLGFAHTNSASYCIMNPGVRSDRDCPSHINPVYKLQKGWIDAAVYKTAQSNISLPPIETSHECAIVTMLGDPSASPDNQTGEYYVLENRREVGFDQRMVKSSSFNDFKGGMLVWHYSPYGSINEQPCGPNWENSVINQKIQLEDPNGENVGFCEGNGGLPDNFYGYLGNFETISSLRSKTAGQITTGIEIRNIESISNTTTSGMTFDIEYDLGPPPSYDYVIYNRDQSNIVKNLDGIIYYHSQDPHEYYDIEPSTIIEVAPGRSFSTGAINAEGMDERNIIFRGPGYASTRAGISPLYVNAGATYSTIDEIRLKFIELQNVNGETDMSIGSGSDQIPILISDLFLSSSPSFQQADIFLSGTGTGASINELSIEGYNLVIGGSILFPENADFHDNRIQITPGSQINFADFKGWTLTDCVLTAFTDRPEYPIEFNKITTETMWDGISCSNTQVSLNSIKVKNSENGISIDGIPDNSSIENSLFENNYTGDIRVDNNIESAAEVVIKDNIMNCSDHQSASISSYNMFNIVIENNEINNSRGYGIAVFFNENPLIKENQVTGDNNAGFSAGILSYSSNGSYNCNIITNCNDYGMLLDNSSPYMFNNEIYGNGIGLYLSNNSYPVLAPSFTESETAIDAGYNKIHHNGDEEIYCYTSNSREPSPIPYMYLGQNSVYDDNSSGTDILINNKYYSLPQNIIQGQENYWGGPEPIGRFDPVGCIDYSNYLTTDPTSSCIISENSQDNSSLAQSILLFGEARNDFNDADFTGSLTNYYSLLSLTGSTIEPVIPLNNILSATINSGGDLDALENFYETYAQTNITDTNIYAVARDLAIETKVQRLLLSNAISDYDEIITNSNDSTEVYYAEINKLRVVSLLLDSLINFYGSGGDNMTSHSGNDLKTVLSSLSSSERQSHKIDKGINKLTWLENVINAKIANFDNLVTSKKKALISQFILRAVTVNNLKYDIASKTTKIAYLNKQNTSLPGSFHLEQNYPNPFNPLTTIKYGIAKPGLVDIRVYDITGREVAVLVNEIMQEGEYNVIFNGSSFSSGIYFYRIKSDNFIQTKRMILVK